jgi:hypothetical protein
MPVSSRPERQPPVRRWSEKCLDPVQANRKRGRLRQFVRFPQPKCVAEADGLTHHFAMGIHFLLELAFNA